MNPDKLTPRRNREPRKGALALGGHIAKGDSKRRRKQHYARLQQDYQRSRIGKLAGRLNDGEPHPVTVIKPDGTQELFAPEPTKRERRKLNATERARKTINSFGYETYLAGRHWQRVKRQYYALNDKRCARCSSLERIQLHHLTYEHVGAERMTDLVALCHACHKAEHGITSAPAEAAAA